MSQWNRRLFIAGGVGALTAGSLSGFSLRVSAKGKGQLEKDPKKVLDLPKGFRYTVLDQVGNKMDDGFTSPGRPDGMGCFKVGDNLVLMRNHELYPAHLDAKAYKAPQNSPKEAFDPLAVGGVSRIVLDAKTLTVKSKNLVLAGTHLNCAGGISPWGWLSCEETIAKGHGYVFMCDPLADKLAPAKPIKAYGRFNHEAVCINPADHTAYLTEDRGDSSFYRFVPKQKTQPFEGTFQAMRLKGRPNFHLGTSPIKVGDTFAVEWVTVTNQDSPNDDLRYRAQKQGAAIISRGEGIWYSKEGIYFTATSGGPVAGGQIFRLAVDGKTLTLVAQSMNRDELDMPDNITVAPSGDLIVAEDGERTPHIRAISKNGKIVDIAKNPAGQGEFAGVCFSPDGKVLFANLQVQGLTVAIEGPFANYISSQSQLTQG